MRITSINAPQEVSKKYDLAPIKMSKLGKVVIVAGKNGAGKTRLFKLIKQLYTECPTIPYSELDHSIQHSNNVINDVRAGKHYLGGSSAEEIIKNNEQHILAKKIQIEQKKWIEFNSEKYENSLINFFPKNANLSDTYTMSREQLENNYPTSSNPNIDHIAYQTTPVIQVVCTDYFLATHPEISLRFSPEDNQRKIDAYKRLNLIIKKFLNAELSIDEKGNASLFGKRIFLAELSHGQIILLQFIVSIYLHQGSIDNLILLIDEPENHLHPAALIEVLDTIVASIKEGQIWIATHNINVISHFDALDTWYMEDGKVAYAGNIPDKVVTGLLGNENEIAKLSSFLERPHELSFNQFSYQCLLPPAVLFTGIDDKQVNQAHNIFSQNLPSSGPLKILDFGIGQGRILATINQLEIQEGRSIVDRYNYYGYDLSSDYKDQCEELFLNIYGSSNKRYFNSSDDLIASQDKESFDYILLANVFHEIHPRDWITLFSSPNSVFKLLKPEGRVLIIEDQVLPIGEHAHSNGFLVFDAIHFQNLFKIIQDDKPVHIFHPENSRLKAHFIPQKCLTRIDAESRVAAIRSLLDSSSKRIQEIRSATTRTFQQGRQLAFWTQQLANCIISLEDLTGNLHGI